MSSDATDVALTADSWTSLTNDSYLGVTSHTISSNWELQSIAVALKVIEDRHYTSAFAQHFSSVATESDIFDKVTYIQHSRDRPKFGFSAETGDIFSFCYGRNCEAQFRPTFGYGRNYDKVSACTETVRVSDSLAPLRLCW